jgi:hypothetical protein
MSSRSLDNLTIIVVEDNDDVRSAVRKRAPLTGSV